MTETSEAVGEVVEKNMAENGTNGTNGATADTNGKVCTSIKIPPPHNLLPFGKSKEF